MIAVRKMNDLPNEILTKILDNVLKCYLWLVQPLEMVCSLWRNIIVYLIPDKNKMVEKSICDELKSLMLFKCGLSGCFAKYGYLQLLK